MRGGKHCKVPLNRAFAVVPVGSRAGYGSGSVFLITLTAHCSASGIGAVNWRCDLSQSRLGSKEQQATVGASAVHSNGWHAPSANGERTPDRMRFARIGWISVVTIHSLIGWISYSLIKLLYQNTFFCSKLSSNMETTTRN